MANFSGVTAPHNRIVCHPNPSNPSLNPSKSIGIHPNPPSKSCVMRNGTSPPVCWRCGPPAGLVAGSHCGLAAGFEYSMSGEPELAWGVVSWTPHGPPAGGVAGCTLHIQIKQGCCFTAGLSPLAVQLAAIRREGCTKTRGMPRIAAEGVCDLLLLAHTMGGAARRVCRELWAVLRRWAVAGW